MLIHASYPFVISGVGLGIIAVVAVTAIPDYFCRWKGVAFGMVSVGSGLGNFIYPYIIEVLSRTYGWQGALLLLAGISFNACVCAATLRPLRLDKQDTSKSLEIQDSDTKSTLQTCHALFSRVDFSILCASIFLYTFGYSVFATHMPTYSAKELHLDALEMSTLVSATGLSGVVARVILGPLLDVPGVDTQIVEMLLLLLMGIASGCVPFVTNYIGMVVVSVLFGISFAGYGGPLAAITLLYSGDDLFVFGYGYMSVLSGVGMFLGAPVAGTVIFGQIHSQLYHL